MTLIDLDRVRLERLVSAIDDLVFEGRRLLEEPLDDQARLLVVKRINAMVRKRNQLADDWHRSHP